MHTKNPQIFHCIYYTTICKEKKELIFYILASYVDYKIKLRN